MCVCGNHKQRENLPAFCVFLIQLHLSCCIIRGADKIAVLVYLPDVLFNIIVQDAAGSSGGERRCISRNAISVPGAGHVLDTEHVKTVGSG
jgi:hypothetical protein